MIHSDSKGDETYLERQRIYLEWAAGAEFTPGSGVSDVFTQIPRLVLEREPLKETLILSSLDLIAERRDCADFALAGLLRILYRFPASPLLSDALRGKIEAAVLKFCYWYNQPGVRGMCFHTENHQILFHSCELLAGQLFPEAVFENDGQTGRWHIQHASERIYEWIDQRARFGFVEWLSNCYFEEDLLALLNLVDFAQDGEIQAKARMLVDMILLEIAMHHFKGVLATTHGRTYASWIKGGRKAPTTQIAWLVFGMGELNPRINYALTALCTSAYRCPQVIEAIARDRAVDVTLRERHGLNVADAPQYGLDPAQVADNMFFWACQTSRHPAARQASLDLAHTANDPWLVDFVKSVDTPLPVVKKLVEDAGGVFDGDAVNTALSEVNLITFRTPAYQLSCAQDFRPAKPGYQQHIWQATLGPDAVVFTTHPGTDDEKGDHLSRPNYWAGNRYLPRAAQHRNAAIILHHIPADDPRPYSHAYFPRQAFDQAMQYGHWTFGKLQAGYIALYSQHPTDWAEEGPYAGIDLCSSSADNIWICELGSERENGSFENFIQAVRQAAVICDGLKVRYQSPSLGEMTFGWLDPLVVRGEEMNLRSYPRFDNPYIRAEIGDRRYEVQCGEERLRWDFTR